MKSIHSQIKIKFARDEFGNIDPKFLHNIHLVLFIQKGG
jgi:hypothetical protein